MEKLTENMIRFAESKLGSKEYAGWCSFSAVNRIGMDDKNNLIKPIDIVGK